MKTKRIVFCESYNEKIKLLVKIFRLTLEVKLKVSPNAFVFVTQTCKGLLLTLFYHIQAKRFIFHQVKVLFFYELNHLRIELFYKKALHNEKCVLKPDVQCVMKQTNMLIPIKFSVISNY